MVVLQVLRYDICAITAHDFVDLLLSRLPISCQHAATVRQHTQTFIALCTTGSSFNVRPFFHFALSTLGWMRWSVVRLPESNTGNWTQHL